MGDFQNDVSMSLGRIEQKLDSSIIDHGARLVKLEDESEQHKKFRWRMIGGGTVLGFLFSGLPSKIAEAVSKLF